MRILLLGYGRMGRLVESLAGEHGMHVAGIVGRELAARPAAWPDADVAIDFSTADGVLANLEALAARGTCAVVGTTGWQAQEAAARAIVAASPIGVVASPNFAIGVHLFTVLAEHAARLLEPQASFGTWIHELHHSAKRDAPSGTARHLEAALRRGGFTRPIDVASTRAGAIPGTHTIGFDGGGETITLTHAVRDRTPFARGALDAARWVHGRQGWFTLSDVVSP
jgi:4-hydroxy-tetrahydrodipicolinate reductase